MLPIGSKVRSARLRVVSGLALWTVAWGAACGVPTLSLRPEPRAFTPRDYERVYEAWTRAEDAFAFGSFSDVLHVTATFQAWELRWAYVIRYADDHALDTDTRGEMLRASLADAQQNHRFFVTLVGDDYRASDLTSEEAAWRVVLIDEEGRQTVPVEVERIDRPDQTTRRYFPSITPHRHAFRIVFPAVRPDGSQTIPRDAGHALLRFTGAGGRVDLRWDFGAPGSPVGNNPDPTS